MFPDSPVCCADMFRIFRTPSFATLYRLESPVWVSALRGPAVRKLVDSEAVQLSLFAPPPPFLRKQESRTRTAK